MHMPERVLAVEDSPVKWADVAQVVRPLLPAGCDLVHVGNMASARQHIMQGGWDLLLLDVSLDVNERSGGNRGAKEFTGGLQLASRMHYLDKSIPTIVITGFETFVAARPQAEQDMILGLQDVERTMRGYLGEDVIGMVRYGNPGWQEELTAMLKGFME